MQENPEGIPFIENNLTRSKKRVYNGAILQLYVNEIEQPNGTVVERELIHHLPAVAVLAENDQEEVVLVRQYRPAIAKEIYEVPAGIIDIVNGQLEEPLTSAKREFEEETSYQADYWQEIASFYVTPGYLDEEITLYYAKGLAKADDPLSPDEDEEITCHWFNRQEIQSMLKNNEIIDLKTLFALNYWVNL